MSRIRQVWPREQVAHLWANASQDSARDPSGNFYFTGPELYSYGPHFAIGYRFTLADGSPLFLLNADGYSSTTARHVTLARRAIARGLPVHFAAGLARNSFTGQQWRGRLLREVAAQAGRLYADAAKLNRKSGRRDGIAAAAAARMETAAALAGVFLADSHAAKECRTAARAVLRTLESVRAVNLAELDSAGERAAYAERAGLLVRDEKRAEMLDKVERAGRVYAMAADSAHSSAGRRWQWARDAANLHSEARELARAYGLRLPRLPNTAALVAQLEPAAMAEALRVALDDARAKLEHAERSVYLARRSGQETGAGWRRSARWHWDSANRYASDVEHYAAAATRNGGAVPAWQIERAANIVRRTQRGQQVELVAGRVAGLPNDFETAHSYAANGYARDAVRSYQFAIGRFNAAEAILDGMPTHPAAVALAALRPERDRAADYIATAAARLAEQHAADIAAWRAGDLARFPGSHELRPLLRLSRDGRNIETSHGAIVPASVAPRLWRIIESARTGDAAAVSDRVRGLHVGPFTLNAIRADGSAVIGCHDIEHSEMAALAARLNLSA